MCLSCWISCVKQIFLATPSICSIDAYKYLKAIERIICGLNLCTQGQVREHHSEAKGEDEQDHSGEEAWMVHERKDAIQAWLEQAARFKFRLKCHTWQILIPPKSSFDRKPIESTYWVNPHNQFKYRGCMHDNLYGTLSILLVQRSYIADVIRYCEKKGNESLMK